MSIKIEGGDGTAENVIKAGTSNELLYNDKEVLLKENFDLGLLPPDLSKTQEYELVTDLGNKRPFIVPEDGWIVEFKILSRASGYIKIDGLGGQGITPSQEYHNANYDNFKFDNLNCPYPVKKGQKIESSVDYSTTITFAPCMSV